MPTTKPDKQRASASPSVVQRAGKVTVRLQYAFDSETQDGDAVENPVIELLSAVATAGSIRHAAQHLGKSYRHVWGTLRHWERVFGEPLLNWSQGQRSRLTTFAEQLLHAERQTRAQARPHIESLRAELTRILDNRPDRARALALRASHDLALPVLKQHLAEQERLDLDLQFEGSVDALRSLRDRHCLLAGFHVPDLAAAIPAFAKTLRPYLNAEQHRVLVCSHRTQGLMMRKEHATRVGNLADVATRRMRFVNRQLGSGTRMLIDHLLQSGSLAGADIPGFESHVETSHLAAALCIAGGVADVGVGVEAAALHYGLHFLPLVTETYYLACRSETLDTPGMQSLQKALAGAAWRRILSTMPGYSAADHMGQARPVNATFAWLTDA